MGDGTRGGRGGREGRDADCTTGVAAGNKRIEKLEGVCKRLKRARIKAAGCEREEGRTKRGVPTPNDRLDDRRRHHLFLRRAALTRPAMECRNPRS